MSDDTLLIAKLMALPPDMRQEVLQFVDFLLYKAKEELPINNQNRKAGFGQVRFTMSADFDEPLDDFKEYFA